MYKITYAIGDIHGRKDLLDELINSISEFHALMYTGQSAQIVCLGDYIDGGQHGIDVIDRLMKGFDGFHTVCLLGNHEDLMLACLDTNNPKVWQDWVENGGRATLEGLQLLDIANAPDKNALSMALGEERIKWLKSLSLFHHWENYVFVHAGIVPGVPIEDQNKHDLLWIRGRFLESNVDHGAIIVHGHTPGDEPVVRSNRICIDTGATSNGILTAVALSSTTSPLFLRTH